MERLYLIFLITISVNQNICLSLNIICCAGSLVHHSDKSFFFHVSTINQIVGMKHRIMVKTKPF